MYHQSVGMSPLILATKKELNKYQNEIKWPNWSSIEKKWSIAYSSYLIIFLLLLLLENLHKDMNFGNIGERILRGPFSLQEFAPNLPIGNPDQTSWISSRNYIMAKEIIGRQSDLVET